MRVIRARPDPGEVVEADESDHAVAAVKVTAEAVNARLDGLGRLLINAAPGHGWEW